MYGNTLQSAQASPPVSLVQAVDETNVTARVKQATIAGFDAVNVPFPEKLRDDAVYLMSLSPEDATDPENGSFNPEVAGAIRTVWSHPLAKEVVRSSFRFQLNDSAT